MVEGLAGHVDGVVAVLRLGGSRSLDGKVVFRPALEEKVAGRGGRLRLGGDGLHLLEFVARLHVNGDFDVVAHLGELEVVEAALRSHRQRAVVDLVAEAHPVFERGFRVERRESRDLPVVVLVVARGEDGAGELDLVVGVLAGSGVVGLDFHVVRPGFHQENFDRSALRVRDRLDLDELVLGVDGVDRQRGRVDQPGEREVVAARLLDRQLAVVDRVAVTRPLLHAERDIRLALVAGDRLLIVGRQLLPVVVLGVALDEGRSGHEGVVHGVLVVLGVGRGDREVVGTLVEQHASRGDGGHPLLVLRIVLGRQRQFLHGLDRRDVAVRIQLGAVDRKHEIRSDAVERERVRACRLDVETPVVHTVADANVIRKQFLFRDLAGRIVGSDRKPVLAVVILAGDLHAGSLVRAVPGVVVRSPLGCGRRVGGDGNGELHDRRALLGSHFEVVRSLVAEAELQLFVAARDGDGGQRLGAVGRIHLDRDAAAAVVTAGNSADGDIRVGAALRDHELGPIGTDAQAHVGGDRRDIVAIAHVGHGDGPGGVAGGVSLGDDREALPDVRLRLAGIVAVGVHRIDPVVVVAGRGDAPLVGGRDFTRTVFRDRHRLPQRGVGSRAVLQDIARDTVLVGGGAPIDDEVAADDAHRRRGPRRKGRRRGVDRELGSGRRGGRTAAGVRRDLPGVVAVQLLRDGDAVAGYGVVLGGAARGQGKRVVVNAEFVVAVRPSESQVGAVAAAHHDLGLGHAQSGRRRRHGAEADGLAGRAVRHIEVLDLTVNRVDVALGVLDRDAVVDLAHPGEHRRGGADRVVERERLFRGLERVDSLAQEIPVVGDLDLIDDGAVVFEVVVPPQLHGDAGEHGFLGLVAHFVGGLDGLPRAGHDRGAERGEFPGGRSQVGGAELRRHQIRAFVADEVHRLDPVVVEIAFQILQLGGVGLASVVGDGDGVDLGLVEPAVAVALVLQQIALDAGLGVLGADPAELDGELHVVGVAAVVGHARRGGVGLVVVELAPHRLDVVAHPDAEGFAVLEIRFIIRIVADIHRPDSPVNIALVGQTGDDDLGRGGVLGEEFLVRIAGDALRIGVDVFDLLLGELGLGRDELGFVAGDLDAAGRGFPGETGARGGHAAASLVVVDRAGSGGRHLGPRVRIVAVAVAAPVGPGAHFTAVAGVAADAPTDRRAGVDAVDRHGFAAARHHDHDGFAVVDGVFDLVILGGNGVVPAEQSGVSGGVQRGGARSAEIGEFAVVDDLDRHLLGVFMILQVRRNDGLPLAVLEHDRRLAIAVDVHDLAAPLIREGDLFVALPVLGSAAAVAEKRILPAVLGVVEVDGDGRGAGERDVFQRGVDDRRILLNGLVQIEADVHQSVGGEQSPVDGGAGIDHHGVFPAAELDIPGYHRRLGKFDLVRQSGARVDDLEELAGFDRKITLGGDDGIGGNSAGDTQIELAQADYAAFESGDGAVDVEGVGGKRAGGRDQSVALNADIVDDVDLRRQGAGKCVGEDVLRMDRVRRFRLYVVPGAVDRDVGVDAPRDFQRVGRVDAEDLQLGAVARTVQLQIFRRHRYRAAQIVPGVDVRGVKAGDLEPVVVRDVLFARIILDGNVAGGYHDLAVEGTEVQRLRLDADRSDQIVYRERRLAAAGRGGNGMSFGIGADRKSGVHPIEIHRLALDAECGKTVAGHGDRRAGIRRRLGGKFMTGADGGDVRTRLLAANMGDVDGAVRPDSVGAEVVVVHAGGREGGDLTIQIGFHRPTVTILRGRLDDAVPLPVFGAQIAVHADTDRRGAVAGDGKRRVTGRDQGAGDRQLGVEIPDQRQAGGADRDRIGALVDAGVDRLRLVAIRDSEARQSRIRNGRDFSEQVAGNDQYPGDVVTDGAGVVGDRRIGFVNLGFGARDRGFGVNADVLIQITAGSVGAGLRDQHQPQIALRARRRDSVRRILAQHIQIMLFARITRAVIIAADGQDRRVGGKTDQAGIGKELVGRNFVVRQFRPVPYSGEAAAVGDAGGVRQKRQIHFQTDIRISLVGIAGKRINEVVLEDIADTHRKPPENFTLNFRLYTIITNIIYRIFAECNLSGEFFRVFLLPTNNTR